MPDNDIEPINLDDGAAAYDAEADVLSFRGNVKERVAYIYIGMRDWDQLVFGEDGNVAGARIRLARLAALQRPTEAAGGALHYRVRYDGSIQN